jgi:hypothetical protein
VGIGVRTNPPAMLASKKSTISFIEFASSITE